MDIYSNTYASGMHTMEKGLHFMCLRKELVKCSDETQIATQKDLIIKGYNLNNIVKDQDMFEDNQKMNLYNIPVYENLTEYLTDKYLHSCQQNLASLFLCNLYFIGQPKAPPSDQLTKTILHLIEKGSIIVVENCLTLIKNVVLDFPKWKLKLITETQICEVLCRSLARKELKRKGFHKLHNYTVIKTMIALINCAPHHKLFEQFLQGLAPYLAFCAPDKENILIQDHFITFKAYVCFYYYMQMFPKESSIFIESQNIYQKLQDIRIWCTMLSDWISYISLKIIEMLLKHINLFSHKFTQTKFISSFIKLIEERNTIFQFAAYPVLIKAIEQKKIQALSVAQKNLFEERIKVEDDNQEILYSLAKIYVLAQAQAKDHKYSEKVKYLLDIVKCKFPQHKTLIGYIDASVSQFRAK